MENNIKIAIADSHTMFRYAITAFIENFVSNTLCFKVIISAANGDHLLEQIKKSATQPEICVVDILMPNACGLEVLQQINTLYPDIKLLILSNFCDKYCIMEALRRGADGIISKNATPQELHSALMSLHNNGYYHPKELTPYIKKVMNATTNNTLHLSEKELHFLKLCCSPKTYKEIAAEMHKSPDAINDLCNGLFKKLGVNTRQELVIFAMKTAIMPIYSLDS